MGGWRYSGALTVMSENSRGQTGTWFIFSTFDYIYGVKTLVRHFECVVLVCQVASGCVAASSLLTM